jgi:hypothetical protein
MAKKKRTKGVRAIIQRKAVELSSRRTLQTTPKWEFLVRTFDSNSLSYMKSLGGMYPSIQPRGWMPGVYCHYLSSEVIPEQLFNTWNFGFENSFYTAIIHPDALKDLQFTVCKGMMYGTCINPYLPEDARKNYQVMTSSLSRKKRPNMKKLSNWINKTLNPSQFNKLPIMDYYNFDDGYSASRKGLFPRTHEVIFKKIPLKYICAIITSRKEHADAINTYLEDIPVILVEEPNVDEQYYYRDVIVPVLEKLYNSLT